MTLTPDSFMQSATARMSAITRRNACQIGLTGFGALGWQGLGLASPSRSAVAADHRRAKSVILIFNCGAPSHIDLWDMKPLASDQVRGEFQPIDTAVPGLQISELMPQLAQRADRLSIVRSVHHRHSSHNSGMYWSIVGRPYDVDSTLINPSRNDYPSFGTLAGWLAVNHGYSNPLPPYVITPAPHCDSTVYLTPGQFGACLGAKYDPFVLNSDPNASNFRVRNLERLEELPIDRLQDRQSLLSALDQNSCRIETEMSDELVANRDKAISLITSESVSQAFDLTKEPAGVRDRYGRHTWGQSHLLARRLVEAGVPFVTTVNGQSIVWDTHKDNFGRLKNNLVPPMEQAFAALLDDLHDRGLLDSTLIVWMGDFGRTPIINKEAGRDHWPRCYSMVLAGGGIRPGQVVGESDKTGAVPLSRPVSPADIHATVFTALGYDPHGIVYHTADGRPILLSEGEPISELL